MRSCQRSNAVGRDHPANDPFPNHFQVMSTPVVVDFDLDQNPQTLEPSIVFTSFPTANSYFNPGVLAHHRRARLRTSVHLE